jgi:hypothetical protein
MRRREFIAALAGAVAWPVAARGQPCQHARISAAVHLWSATVNSRSVERCRDGLQARYAGRP